METIDNDKHPITPPQSGNRRYPFGELKEGESFFAANTTVSVVMSAAWQYRKRHGGGKFTARTVDGGVRCWRVAEPVIEAAPTFDCEF